MSNPKTPNKPLHPTTHSKNPQQSADDPAPTETEGIVRSLKARLSALEEENQTLRAEATAARYRLAHSQERDRAALAQALHGGPIQEFSSLLFEINVLQQMVQEEASAELLGSLKKNLQDAIRSLRQFINQLRPAALFHFGLQSAVRSALEQFQANHVDVHPAFFSDTEERVHSVEVELMLYRVFQAALDNVAQHAQARHLMVRLRRDEEAVWLEVEDDGVGFQIPEDWDDLFRQNQMGLVVAREHVAAFDAALTVQSTPGAGTIVRVTVPRQQSAT